MKRKCIKLMSAVLMILLLLTATVGAVQAATTEKYTVAFEYDTGKCSIKLTVDGIVISPTEEDAKVYLVDKNHATFSVQITPKPGYSISPMIDKETGSALAASDPQGSLYEPPLNKDKVFCIEGAPKNYTIQEIAGPGQGHDLVFHTKSYEYDSDEPVFLPLPTLDGYEFIGWRIFDEAEQTNVILNTISGEGVKFPTSSYPVGSDVLYAQPMWEGIPQTVTRYDYEYDPNGNTNIPVNDGNGVSHTTSWTEPNGTENVTGKDGNTADIGALLDRDGYKTYVGYYDFADYAADSKYFTVLQKVKTDHEANRVHRYYVPISYKLNFENIDSTDGYPKTHVYNTKTSFVDLKPTRTGYDFAGWKVYIQKNGERVDITASIGNLGLSAIENLTLSARETVLADGNANNEITLEATWVAKTYGITYDWSGADEEKITFTKAEGYVFDTELVLTDPVRAGYTFLGWSLTSGEIAETIDSVDGKTVLVAKKYTDAIVLTARWQANEYTVTLDGAGATKPGTDSFKVTFDGALPTEGLILPEKEGHEFLGFATADGRFYLDAEGKSLAAVWDIPADTVLYANWKVLSYKVTVNATDCEIYLNDTLYQGTAMEFPYGTTVKIVVKAANTHKVTAWQGKAVGHTHTFETSIVMGAKDETLSAAVLPMIGMPAFRVDYVAEHFTTAETLPNGTYRIACGTETLSIRVTNGTVYVNEVEVTAIVIPEGFFGKTVEITAFGDATATADSDPISVSLAARPSIPLQNDHIGSIYPGSIDQIVITRNPNSTYTYEYEFAVALNPDGTGLVWKTFADLTSPKQDTYVFEGLNPGTIYYVYVRVKASDGNYPHGQVNMTRTNTMYDDYLKQKISDLQKLIDENDGEIVRALIAKAIEDANALETPSATFYEDLEGIYNRVLIAAPFARQQDGRIAELRALRDALIASGEFSGESTNKLNDLCSTAVSSITAAKTGDEVETLYQTAVANMKAVKISYLFFENAKLISFAGLPQGSKLYAERMENIAALITAIDDAIASGRLAVAGESMTLAEAVEAFRSLDVMAGYTLRLSKDDAAYTRFEGNYEFRVLLPEELWGVSGLQVVYYDAKSGIEVLDTVRDGNYIVFTATHLADFAILGDPVMNLTSLIITLGLVLACQLLAIILMLARRVKNARRATYHASVALPVVALTIRFLPANGLTLVLVLGALVVVMQIVLLYLLLSTDMVHRKREDEREYHTHREEPTETPVMAAVDAVEPTEEETDPFAGFDEVDEAYPIDEAAQSDADTDENDTEETEGNEGEDDGIYVDLRTGEVFGDPDSYEDFIEPAANPKYSLPEEDEPTEEYPAEEYPQAPVYDGLTEAEWQYDDEAPEEAPEGAEDAAGFAFEPVDDGDGDYYDPFDDSIRGEPAEDLPQEEPVEGEPADDLIDDEPIRGDLPEYEQPATELDDADENNKYVENNEYVENGEADTLEGSADPDKTKQYDGYEE